jgi:hypothetical protein
MNWEAGASRELEQVGSLQVRRPATKHAHTGHERNAHASEGRQGDRTFSRCVSPGLLLIEG